MCVFFVFAPRCFAQSIVINEFSSASSPEWVEIYNSGNTEVDLTGWQIWDEKNNGINLEGCIKAKSFRSFKNSKWLNNPGDEIKLINNKGEEIDKIVYGNEEIPAPDSTSSASRNPDGSENWKICISPNRQNDQCQLPELSQSPSEEDENEEDALVVINDVKDENGEVLSSVKVYMDDEYLNHYAPEEIKCSPGEHTFKLEKSGYDTWEEKKELEEGKDYVFDIILNKKEDEEQSSPTPSPTLFSIPSPSVSASPEPSAGETKIASISGMVLGATESGSETEKSPFPSASDKGEKENTKANIFPFIFIGTGSIITSSVFFLLWQQGMLKNLW